MKQNGGHKMKFHPKKIHEEFGSILKKFLRLLQIRMETKVQILILQTPAKTQRQMETQILQIKIRQRLRQKRNIQIILKS